MMKTILSALVLGAFLVSGVAFAGGQGNDNAAWDKAKGRYTGELQQVFAAHGEGNDNAAGDKAHGEGNDNAAGDKAHDR